jgi:predicted helicase
MGHGLVGMITNHSYLDNPTFRGMRQSLMQTFDEIYVLDLHGNSLKRETSPDGSKDENVFDIRQGVAIAFFVKRNKNTGWEEIHPKAEFHLFVPRDEAALELYNEFVRVTEIFSVHSLGFQTHRDRFVIDFDRDTLKRRIRMFRDPNMPDEMIQKAYGLKNTRSWRIAETRKKLQADEDWEMKITRCLYRPFDRRWIFYHPDLVDRCREVVMRHMVVDANLC